MHPQDRLRNKQVGQLVKKTKPFLSSTNKHENGFNAVKTICDMFCSIIIDEVNDTHSSKLLHPHTVALLNCCQSFRRISVA